MLNANILLTHSAAALAGHTGPARRDDRARGARSAELTNGSAWVDKAPGSGAARSHAPGWRDGLRGGGIQHLVVDTEIAWALPFAWRAREAIGLDQAAADRIADLHHQHDRGRVLALAGAAAEPGQLVRADVRRRPPTVGGPSTSCHAQLQRQLRRFVDGARRADGAARRSPTSARATASTTCRRLAGAPQVQPRQRRVREHRLSASWSPTRQARDAGHARRWTRTRRERDPAPGSSACWRATGRTPGYLNWDTGLGFKRWHQGKKLGLCAGRRCSGSRSPRSSPAPRSRRVGQAHARPRASSSSTAGPSATAACRRRNAFAVPSIDANEGSQVLAAARVQANAAQAALYGLGQHGRRASRRRCTPTTPTSAGSRSPRPPTTPRSSRSTGARSRTAGIELARLFDGRAGRGRRASAGGRRRPSASCVRDRRAAGSPRPRSMR